MVVVEDAGSVDFPSSQRCRNCSVVSERARLYLEFFSQMSQFEYRFGSFLAFAPLKAPGHIGTTKRHFKIIQFATEMTVRL